ncbi:MAG: chemotaxis protein CheX [Planctomycetes bacterium]|nr:chemotaxis protein CheX [Planctomycetota bacterium]
MIGQETFADALMDGAREVFETMMFMTVEPCEEGSQEIDGTALLGSITFTGDIEGCLAVCCSYDCAKTIAVNMLGAEDEELAEEEVADAVGEVANMLLGSLKSRIAETAGEVQVSIPSVVSGTQLVNSLGEGAESISQIVNIDEETARFTLLYRDAKG